MDEISKSFAAINIKIMAWLDGAIRSLPNLVVAVVLVAIFWILASWIYTLISRVFRRTHLNNNLEHLMAKTVKVCVIMIGFILGLSVLKLDKAVFSLLAGVGVIGLALGFAFQDLVSNFVSGLMIAIRSPFRVGDVIEVKGSSGSVLDIRLRDTVIKNFSGQHVLIPNKTFMTEEVINYSVNGQRRVEFIVGISNEGSLRTAKNVALSALAGIDGVLQSPAPVVEIAEMTDTSFKLKILFWIVYPGSDVSAIRDEVIMGVLEAFADEHVELPGPSKFEMSSDLAEHLDVLASNGKSSEVVKDRNISNHPQAPEH